MTPNQLLDRLPAAELQCVLSHSQPVALAAGQMLVGQDEPAAALIFPTRGSAVWVTPAGSHPSLQVGWVGGEGVLGAQLLLDASASPAGGRVLQSGEAWSVSARALRQQLPACPVLHRLLLRYLHVQLRQLVTAVACLQAHPLQARLARWLLAWQERAHGEPLAVTHEQIAQLLGVRRVGVTVAAGHLQGAGLICYHRGWIQVRDRPGLQHAACSCHAQDLVNYQAGMGFAQVLSLRSASH